MLLETTQNLNVKSLIVDKKISSVHHELAGSMTVFSQQTVSLLDLRDRWTGTPNVYNWTSAPIDVSVSWCGQDAYSTGLRIRIADLETFRCDLHIFLGWWFQFTILLCVLFLLRWWPLHGLSLVQSCQFDVDGELGWRFHKMAVSGCREKTHHFYCVRYVKEAEVLWWLIANL